MHVRPSRPAYETPVLAYVVYVTITLILVVGVYNAETVFIQVLGFDSHILPSNPSI